MSAADWKPYDVPRLARLLAAQPTDSATHTMAWQRAYETLTDQQQRIQAARTALTQAWPATPGSAAASFLDQVDALTQAMTTTANTAINAHSALTGIVTAIDHATTTIDTLHQAWQQNQTTIGDAVPTNDWTQPLNDQAHTTMAQADTAIAEHTTQLAPPIPYKPPIAIETYTPIESTSGAAGGTRDLYGWAGISSSAPRTDRRTLPIGSAPTSSTGSRLPATSAKDGAVLAGHAIAQSEFAGSPSDAGHLPAPGAIVQPIQSEPVDIGVNGIGAGGSVAFNNHPITASHHVAGQRSNAVAGRRGGVDEVFGSQQEARVRADSTTNSSTTNAVATDGTNRELAARSAAAGSVATGGEYVGPEGILSPGTPAAGSPASSRRKRSAETLRWPMPVGVPAIIEPVAAIDNEHHPGSGVIGIDL